MRDYGPMDLRERVAAAVDDGRWSRRRIARLSSRQRLVGHPPPEAAAQDGHPGPRAAPRRPGPVLDFAERWRLRRLALEHNDVNVR